eukprot:TRINITY_DN16810_c0_g2_i1.p1 TRINITY_DN16810_c0_g2~~TRINITY_DN16810_c0_g2_i1.p1  ORF type:complete len:1026 (+),score=251.65 TRINITY_DN16810_c0_g2_i1:78-3155(+)
MSSWGGGHPSKGKGGGKSAPGGGPSERRPSRPGFGPSSGTSPGPSSASGRHSGGPSSARGSNGPSDSRGYGSSRGTFSASDRGGDRGGDRYSSRGGDRSPPRRDDRLGGGRDRAGSRDRDRARSGGDRGRDPRGSDRDRAPSGAIGGRGGMPPPLGPSSSQGGAAPMPPLHVTGCSNDTVSNIIAGMYLMKEYNHQKPVYKKEGSPGSVTVLIYYWDDRDGSSFNGWWFGPKVGGDQVWAYNGGNLGSTNVMPPTKNWKVPWDGQVDHKLQISFGSQGSQPSNAPGSIGARSSHSHRQDDEERRRREERDRVDRARLLEEQKRREEERMRREREEQRRKDREREEARRQEEQRLKREEEEIKRKQEAAANAVRKVIHRLHNATPENVDAIKAELNAVATQNFQAMGPVKNRINDEMQLSLTQAQKRITEELKQRAEQDRRKKAEAIRVGNLLKEATAEVEAAEAKVVEAQESLKIVDDLSKASDADPQAIVEAAEKAKAVIATAKETLERSESTFKSKQGQMGEGDGAASVKREIDDLRGRISASYKSLSRSSVDLDDTRGRAKRLAAAQKQEKEFKDCFSKHDADGDGHLNRGEVVAFGEAEFGIALPEDVLNKIMRVLEPIGFEKFVPLRQKVAIAKSEADIRKRRAEEEERKKQAELKQEEVQKSCDEVKSDIEAAESKLKEAEDLLKASAKDVQQSSESISEGTEKAEGLAKEAQEVLDATKSKLKEAEEACADVPELRRLARRDVPALQDQHKKTEDHKSKVLQLCESARERATKKASEEVDEFKRNAITAIRSTMTSQDKTGEQIFEEINSGNSVGSESFSKFVKGLESLESLPDKAVDRLFAHIAGSSTGEISKETFLELLKLFFKCVKGTVLGDEISIKSKTVRRLEVGEVLEALEGPTKDEGANVNRVKCRSVQDGAVGWATIAGNQGTSFLEQGGNVFTCVQAVDILKTPDDGPDAVVEVVRQLKKADIFEVLEFRQQADSAVENPTRWVRGKAKSDGAAGWTMICKDSTTYLES